MSGRKNQRLQAVESTVECGRRLWGSAGPGSDRHQHMCVQGLRRNRVAGDGPLSALMATTMDRIAATLLWNGEQQTQRIQ